MRYYFAPLEGITDSVYRALHHKYFPGVDRYYTPFISPTVHRSFTQKEKRELAPADFTMIPQALTKNAEDFLWLAQQCADIGFEELNLNLGCPSGTVTAKGKGSGTLRDTEGLDKLLEEIFTASPIPVSIKTRIGFTDPEEFPRLLEIFNRYPVKELTIHPRTRAAFYNGEVNMDVFSYAVANSKNPLCYNGNLCNREQINTFTAVFPTVQAVMIGRGLIGDPGMLTPGGTTANKLEQFHDELLSTYAEVFGGYRNAMFRIKENWHYWIHRFDGGEKLYKQLRKATDFNIYQSTARAFFQNIPFKETFDPKW